MIKEILLEHREEFQNILELFLYEFNTDKVRRNIKYELGRILEKSNHDISITDISDDHTITNGNMLFEFEDSTGEKCTLKF